MKIAFLLTQSLDSPSGLGRFGPIARELARVGHSVEVLALHYDWSNLARRRFTDAGVQVNYVGQMHVRKVGARKSYYSPAQLLMISLASAARLAAAVRNSNAEVIQLCKPQPINALAARLGRRGRAVFCDCDDYEAATNRFGGEWQRRIVRYFEDGAADYAAGITTNTRFSLERYRQLGYDPARMVYVPNGVERSRFAAPRDEAVLRRRWDIAPDVPLVAYVGTMSMLSHGVDLLLQAFARVVSAVPAARLLLVGGGEDFDALGQMATGLGIREQTIFAGRLAPEQIPAVLALATVSTDPVRDDPVAAARSPLKVIESLAVGTPVVTGDVGDRRGMLREGELGVLVPPGDASGLAAGLVSILKDAALRERLAAAARAGRENWYWDTLIHDFARIYALAS